MDVAEVSKSVLFLTGSCCCCETSCFRAHKQDVWPVAERSVRPLRRFHSLLLLPGLQGALMDVAGFPGVWMGNVRVAGARLSQNAKTVSTPST